MRLEPLGVRARVDGTVQRARFAPGEHSLGPLTIRIRWDGESDPGVARLVWELANESPVTVRLGAVSTQWAVGGVGRVRMWRHGYQSWSASGLAELGRDADPSRRGGAEMLRAAHHSDPGVVDESSELRSEWVTVVADDEGAALLGFVGSGHHDGCFRLRSAPSAGPAELEVEARLEVELGPGQARSLDPVLVMTGPEDSSEQWLARWADEVGAAAGARRENPYQVGWCSWYHYFHRVTESDVLANLERAGEWPFEVFQVDDGFQASIGDWLETSAAFPGGVGGLAERISRAGYRPGLWLAPFLVAPDSQVARRHPEWLARWSGGDRPLHVWFNPAWGGGRGGLMYGLDTTRPDVLSHLEDLARRLTAQGYGYLKLDFTFAPAVDGRWADPTATAAQRVRAGFDAIRRGAGPDTFILGCGVPLSHVVGVVDGVRIGQDVAPRWALDPTEEAIPGYLATQPATQHAYASTLARAFMHRRLWLNDPDCLMLRPTATDLSQDAVRTWARTVGLSGGMAIVSDDLALLGPAERRLLDEVVDLGRRSDDDARRGVTPGVPDRLSSSIPTRISAGGRHLTVDPIGAGSTLTGVAGAGPEPFAARA